MEKDEKRIEVFVDKLMSNETLEHPALDFTDKVMSKVNAISNSTVTVYKPLIPKFIWYVIIGGFLTLVGYVYLKEPVINKVWYNRIDFSHISLNQFGDISFDFSSTLMYAVVLMALMVSIQVPLLKHYFNKRMAY